MWGVQLTESKPNQTAKLGKIIETDKNIQVDVGYFWDNFIVLNPTLSHLFVKEIDKYIYLNFQVSRVRNTFESTIELVITDKQGLKPGARGYRYEKFC